MSEEKEIIYKCGAIIYLELEDKTPGCYVKLRHGWWCDLLKDHEGDHKFELRVEAGNGQNKDITAEVSWKNNQ